jgi:hypothetical protein
MTDVEVSDAVVDKSALLIIHNQPLRDMSFRARRNAVLVRCRLRLLMNPRDPLLVVVIWEMATCFLRGVEASFSKTTGNKTLEFGGVSPSNDRTRYKMESFYFYLI